MKIIVIGGNAAGMSAASRLKRKMPDAEITVYERSSEVSYGACGMPYYIAGLTASLDLLRIRKKEEFEKQGIRVYLQTTAVSLDSATHTVNLVGGDGTEFSVYYDTLILATGASPVIPPINGVSRNGVFVLKSLEDAARIRQCLEAETTRSVAIVGGGYIGLELAEACLQQKKLVHVFESMPHLLNGFDQEFGQAAELELTDCGAKIHVGQFVRSIEGNDRIDHVATDEGKYNADMVLLTTGVRPNTRFLMDSGIRLYENGAIMTDAKMRTNIPDVFAAGDCATVMNRLTNRPAYIPLGTNANKQGRFAADAIMQKPNCEYSTLGTAMLRCMGLEFAKTGLREQEARALGHPAASISVQTKTHARYYPDPKSITIRLCYRTDDHVILGAQLMGRGESAWRIDVLACAIDRKMRAEELGRLDLGYAPPFASVWDAIHIAANAIK